MKYHSQLIKKYISIHDTPENIANKLILKTVEIEEIIKREIPSSIVIGKVTSTEKHPDSDHLNLCQVDCGDKGKFQIVCGANNVTSGLFVPVALEGTVFEKAGITIAKRKLRGVESNGMICSKGELDINEDTDQPRIRDLSQDLPITEDDKGTPLSEKFARLNNYVLDVDNKGLTNRPDLTGHFGIARELNAMYHSSGGINYNKLTEYQETFKHTNIFDLLEHNEKKLGKKVIAETEGLHNYILLALNTIEVKKSGFFMRLQNIDLGNGPINNWVDFSNLFMNISGNPVHFFDADKVEGNIIVRNAREGEEFTDLMGKTHKLLPQDIVIADEKKALCLGGIMGGNNSGVTEETKNILVEIANFDPVALRKTGVRLGLRTDSELRNEKNINPTYSLYALLLFLDELKYYEKELGNFEIGGISSYLKPGLHPIPTINIEVDYPKMQQFIFGKEQEHFQEKAEAILKNLGFSLTGNQIGVPLWRGPEDITIPEDITEEVARIRGYEAIENIPAETAIQNTPFTGNIALIRNIEQQLVKVEGFDQLELYPRVSEKNISEFGRSSEDFIQLQNPVNPECPLLRDSFLYQLVQMTTKNAKFFDEIKLFDTGIIRTKEKPKNQEDSKYAIAHIDEQLHTGIIIYKKAPGSRKEDTLFDTKNAIQSILNALELKGEIEYRPTEVKYFHPKKQATILYQGNEIGVIGSLHPLTLKNNKIPESASCTYAELNLQILEEIKSKITEQTYPFETLQDQILWRDISFVIDEKAEFGGVISAIREVKDIKDIQVFDLYQGSNLPEGKKSLAVKIKIIGDGNMTTEAINEIMQQAIKKAEGVGAELRG